MGSEDLTLEDLKVDQDAQVDTDSDGGEDSAEWVDRLITRLDERGYLDPLIRKSLDLEDVDVGSAPTEADGGQAGGQIGAEDIARFGKMVIDNLGDVPISRVVQFAENNPETVNQLVQQTLEAEG